ncbi:VOC family protein [soil metagenome]
MSNIPRPEGYNRVIPYLILKDGLGFLDFAAMVFGGEKQQTHYQEDGKTLMHGEIRLDDSYVMVGEASDQWKVANAGMFIYVANTDETYQKALDNGATSIMPISNQSYGRTCGVKDAWGNTWWITQQL